MTPQQHRQYLIDKISEMEFFNERLVAKIEAEQANMSEAALQGMCGIVDRKDANISTFKAILKEKYGYTY